MTALTSARDILTDLTRGLVAVVGAWVGPAVAVSGGEKSARRGAPS